MKKSVLLILTAGLLPGIAAAGSRTSAGYAVPTDTIDAGGIHANSPSYAVEASIGEIGGVGNAPAPAALIKHSFIGQLYDVRTVTVAAAPLTINEGETRQLSASAINDDGTALNLSGTQVAWDVLSGPLISVDADGLATAGIVYQNEAASARGTFSGISGTCNLTVVNVNHDDFGLYSGDGLDDLWQVQNFGLNNIGAAPHADPDGDGQDNFFEYAAGTNPNDAQSKFEFTIALVDGRPTQQDLLFSPRLPGRTYTVQYETALAGGWSALSNSMTTDAGLLRTVRDLSATNGMRFYRVAITFP